MCKEVLTCELYFWCRNNVEKKSVLENLDLVLLCLDEIVDGGYAFIFLICFVQLLFLFCPASIVRSSHRFFYHRSYVKCFITGSMLWKDIENCILRYSAHLILLTFVLQCLLMHRIILESDANVIAGRVAMRGAEADVPLSEQVMFFTDFVQCQTMLYLPLL